MQDDLKFCIKDDIVLSSVALFFPLKYMVIVIEPSGISVSYSVGRSAFGIIS